MAQNFLSDIQLGDNIYIRLGDATNGDLQIFHNASNSIIRNDAGDLRFIQYVDDGKIRFYNDNGSGGITEYFRIDGSAEETLFSKQIRVPDNVKIAAGGSSDLQIYHGGTHSFIDNQTGNLYIRNYSDDKNIHFQTDNGSGGITDYIVIHGTENVIKFQEHSRHLDAKEARFGTGSDLKIFHDANNSYIQTTTGSTGDLYIKSQGTNHDLYLQAADDILISPQGGENGIKVIGDGAVELYYDNSKKFETTNVGITVSGTTASSSVLINGGADAQAKILGTTTAARLDIQTDSHHRFLQTIESDGRFRLYNQTTSAEQFSIASNNDATFAGNISSGDITIEDATPVLVLKDSNNGAGGAAHARILFSNTGGKAIAIGTTGDDDTSTDLYISSNASSTYGGYLLLDSDGISDAQADIIIDPKTNFKVFTAGTLALTLDTSQDATFAGNIRTTEDIGRDDHNRIMFSTDDSIIYRVADSHRFRMDSDNFSPYVDSSYDLGTTSKYFRAAYIDAITTTGDVTVGGNLIVNGTTTTINTATVEVEDNILQLNTTQGSPDTATAATSGISIYRGDGVTQASFIFDDGDDTWDLTNNLTIAGNIQATGTRTISAQYDSNHYIRLESNSSGGVLKGTDGGVTTILARSYGDSYFNGGNFGIGTNAPDGVLDVHGASGRWRVNTYGGMYFRNDSDTGHEQYIHARSDGRLSLGRAATSNWSGSGNATFFATTYDHLTFASNSDATFAGNITTSDSKISVTQADGDDLAKLYQTSADGFLELFTGEATPVSRVKLSSYGDSYLAGASTGRVGIGTTSPGAKLEVDSGGTSPMLRLRYNANYYTDYSTNGIDATGTNQTFAIRQNGSGSLSFDTSQNATFAGTITSGNITTQSRITFDYGGDHYFEAGTNSLAYKSSGGSAVMTLNASTSAAAFAGNVTVYTGASTGALSVGRNSAERLEIHQGDTNTTVTAFNDIDENQEHNFILDRSFGGSGGNNFLIRKAGSAQLSIDKDANATFAGDVIMSKDGGPTLNMNTNLNGNTSKILLHEGTTASPANGASIRYDGSANTFKIGVGSNVDTTRLTIDRGTGLATFANDVTVDGGDFNLTKQNGSPTINMLYDGTNPGTNTLLHYLNFKVDYGGTHQDWGGIEHRTNASVTRTDLRFNVKSQSGNVQTGLAIKGGSAAPLVGIGTSDPDAKLEILGNGRTSSTTALNIRSDDDQQLFYVRDDGVVSVTHNYFYVDNSNGMYSNGVVYARGGVSDDGGPLQLGGNSSVGNLTLTSNTSATFAGDVQINGDLIVTGATTSVNVEDLNVEQGEITLNYNASSDTSGSADGSGIRIQDAVNATTDATMLWNATDDRFVFSNTIQAPGLRSTTSNTFTGGMSTFETTYTGNDDWQNSPISIVERGNVNATQSADIYSPNLNFHWGGRVSRSLWMDASGNLNYGEYSSTGSPGYSNGFIRAHEMHAGVFKDKDSTGYYLDPANTGTSLNVAGQVAGKSFKAEGNNTDQYFYEGVRTGVGTTLRIYDNSSDIYYDSWDSMTFRANQNGGSGGAISFTGGNVNIQRDLTIGTGSTHNGALTIRSLDSSSSTRTAKIKFNIAGTDTTGFTLHNNTSGIAANTLIYDVSGTEKVTIYADGHIRTVNNVTAQTFRDQDNTSYYVNPSGTSVMNDIELDDYIVHKGDTDTYFGFNGANSWKLHVGGGDRLIAGTSTLTSNLKVRIPVAWDSGTLENNAIYAKNSTDGFGFGNGTGISTWWAWSTENGLMRMIDVANSGAEIDLRTGNNDRVLIDSSGLTMQNNGDINVGNLRIVGDNDSADQGKAFIRSNGDYLVLNAADSDHVYLNWDGANGGSGHVYVLNNLYAGAFYDRNDTNYYVNPSATSTSVKVAGSVEHKGLSMTDGTNVDQIKEFSMTFQLSANTWTDTGIDGTDLATGTYAMQVYVGDYAVGGNHYDEYYSATISWFSTNTNSTATDEIIVHRAGHAPNSGDVQFRTQRTENADSHDLMLQVKHNLSYTAALDGTTTGKKMIFKFRRLI